MRLTYDHSYIPKCLKEQLFLCQFVVMWPIPASNLATKGLVRLYFLIIAVSLALATVGLLTKVLTSENLLDRSEAIDILTMVSSALYKLMFFTINHERFLWLVQKCVKYEKVLPKDWLKFTPYLSITHPLLAFIIISFWGLCPLLNWVIGVVTWDKLPLPINTVAPDLKGIMFGIAYLWGFISLVSSAHIYMAADIFIFSSIHFVNGAMEELKIRLGNVKNITTGKDSKGKEPRHEYLKQWVRDHTEVCEYMRNLDDLCRSLIVADVLHAIISLSFAMLQSSESQGILEWIKGTFFILYCFIHQYLNSYFGQHLIDQQEAMREAVEEIPFYEGSVPLMKTVLLIYNGTLKPVKLSAWRMYFLQYATFVEFVRTMVSWFMVLRQLNEV